MRAFFLVAILALALPAHALQRTVLFEDFTATWCGPCGVAAPALEQLQHEVGDSLVIAGIHANGDPFYQSDAHTRYDYYGVQYIPTVYADGVLHYTSSTNAYSHYRSMFDLRKTVDQPVQFSLGGVYDANALQGTLRVWVKHVGEETAWSGQLRVYTVLVDTPYAWQGHSHLYWVVRDLVPDPAGVPVSLAPGDSVAVVQPFTVPATDSPYKTAFVVFLQRDDTREVLGAHPLFFLHELDWVGVAEESRAVSSGLRLRATPVGRELRLSVQGLARPTPLSVYDATGRLVLRRRIGNGRHTLRLGPGVYVYRLLNHTGKVVVLP